MVQLLLASGKGISSNYCISSGGRSSGNCVGDNGRDRGSGSISLFKFTEKHDKNHESISLCFNVCAAVFF